MEIVSIIMPAYNSEKYVLETLHSVLEQSFKDWVLYIVDDKSNDNTLNLITGFSKGDRRIVIIPLEKNHGQAYARNKAIKAARGKYIVFLDSDDIWNEKFLENQINFIEEKNCSIAFSAFERKNENLSISYGILQVPDKVDYKALLKDNYLSCLSTIIDISKIGKVYFEEGCKHEDHLMWLKLLRDNVEYAYGNNEVLAIYRIRNGSTSRNKFNAATWKWNIYRCYLKLNIWKSSYYFLHYTINGVKKNLKFIFQK